MSSKGSSKAQDEEESCTTVKFNVGGKLYEVAKTLLTGFPDTVLAEKATLSSSSSPIFIDRDPDRFAFCLDYMRDNGKVYLPETVPKLAILEELKFFGFVDIDETKICDEKSERNFIARLHEFTRASRERIDHMQKEAEALEQQAAALKRKSERRKEEIEMEKVVLKCLAASIDNASDSICVYYNDVDVSYVHRDQYFIERCDKLALKVCDGVGGPSKVYFSRKTATTGEN